MARKTSFFEKLTGAVNVDEEEEEFDPYDDEDEHHEEEDVSTDIEEEAQLAIDLYQTSTEIVIQTMVAGVRPDDLDISISREVVTISGRREGPRGISDGDYLQRELYWGQFKRTVMLPDEIEVDEAEATENHGLLIIRLPKLNKDQKTKLKVKSQ
ncbi:MAG: Hsp20/alpha crystallin family protein [Candidatus Paceibacterota bacterium]